MHVLSSRVRSSPRWLSGVLTVIAIAIVVTVIVLGRATAAASSATTPEGPLDTGNDSTATGFSVDPGRPFSFGYLFLSNPSTAPITLDGIDLVDATLGLRLTSAVVISLKDTPQGVSGTSHDFPPTEPAAYPYAPFAGTTLPPTTSPSDSLNVQIGLEVSDKGDFYARQIAIRYHVGKDTYRKVVHYSLHFCAPMRNDLSCQAPNS